MMATPKKTPAKPTSIPLPPDVRVEDTKWSGEPRGKVDPNTPHSLTFYLVQGRAMKNTWVILTLAIDNRGRSYVVRTDTGGTGRAGSGPHVKAEVKVYLRADNLDRLGKYVELWKKGMVEAGMIRDRIGSRRAQGQIERANGRTSWMWDS